LQGVLGESATNAGAIITPLTISSVIGAAVAGALVATFKRYQLVTIVGSIIATIGVFLLTQMTISTNLLQAAIFMVVAGLGLGVFFSVLTLAAQNSLPRTSLGVGTGAVRFLGQLGSVLGVAIVGSVVNSTLASDIVKRLPAQTVQRLTPQGVKFATNPQVLVNSTYHDTVVQTAQSFAVRSATANVPPGPQHDQIAAQAIHQTTTLLNSVFASLKESLAVAIQHGFIAVLIFCGATILATFFLKDLPLTQRSEYHKEEAGVATQNEVDAPVLP
jgi:MFS family permease